MYIVFSLDSQISEEIANSLKDSSKEVIIANNLAETIEFLEMENLEKVYIYYGDSDKGVSFDEFEIILHSAHELGEVDFRIVPVFPKLECDHLNKFYEKYHFLLSPKSLEDVKKEIIVNNDDFDILGDLVGTINDLWEENTPSPVDQNKVSTDSSDDLVSEGHEMAVDGDNLFENEKQTVKGEISDFGDNAKLVKGGPEETEAVSTVSGGQLENLEEEAIKVKGLVEKSETEDKTTLGPDSIEEENSIQVVGGDLEDLDDVQTISGLSEEAEKAQLVKGQKEDLVDNSSTLISGDGDLNSADEAHSISVDQVEKEEAQILSGEESIGPGGLMKGSLKEGEVEAEETITLEGDAPIKDEFDAINGEREKIVEETFIVSGDGVEPEKEDVTVIEGSNPRIDDGKDEKVVIKAEEEEEEVPWEVKKLKAKEQIQKAPKDHIDKRNDRGETQLMLAAKSGDDELVKGLILDGANKDLMSKKGMGILHYAAQSNNLELFEFLVEEEGLKISKRDSEGRDPLFFAVASGSTEIVHSMIKSGARLNTKINGKTYLHIAAEFNKFDCFKQLLIGGCNPSSQDQNGKSVHDFCLRKRMVPYLKLMEAFKQLNDKKKAS